MIERLRELAELIIYGDSRSEILFE